MTKPILDVLRDLPADADAEAWWRTLTAEDWPALFPLLGIAADLPRLKDSSALAATAPELWPELARVGADVLRLQRLVDHPAVPPAARPAPVFSIADSAAAQVELAESRCVTVDFLFDELGRQALAAQVEELARERMGAWGEVSRDERPALFDLVDAALGGDRFGDLTGFDLDRDDYTLTLSLQDLDPAGIGWHRDLYWPREWVGEDVFSVLYGLGDDSPAKGGAFLYYVPEHNGLWAVYRRRHQATVLWNCRDGGRRLLHAVSGYRGEDTSRHLLILQCRRRDGRVAGPGPRATPGAARQA
jgi:hypothetical protein